jgi:ABC-type cobalamin/Fe3+-siderophores transport system ATPase subunit
MSTDDPIQIDDLLVSIRGHQILRVDHLRVPRGQVLAVLGPNGAGKTTLLRTCAGYQRYASGTLRALGQDLAILGVWGTTRLRRRIGFVPQLLAVAGELPVTVREVVAIGRTGIRGLMRPLGRNDWRCVDAWIERLGLHEEAGRPYAETSGGQQRKALLARAMVQEPELLLLDEPAAHLDLGAREQIVRTIEELHAQLHLTVVLVCHEVEVLPPACSMVMLLGHGVVQAVGTPEEVLNDTIVRSLYGPGLSVLHQGGRHAVLPAAEGWR